MKIKINLRMLMAVLLLMEPPTWAATNDISGALQKGLFEEEANQNLPAAIEAYQSVIQQLDANRKLAATAIFRLAECYRKQGKTNEAVVQYQRVVHEFGDQATLATFSEKNLASLQAGGSGEAGEKTNTNLSYLSIEAREIKRLEKLIKDSPDLINASGQSGSPWTPLQNAVQQGYLTVAEFLLQQGADPNLRNNQALNGKTALHLAAEAGNKNMVTLLLDSKADVNSKDSTGQSALHLAAGKGFKAVAELLLKAGAEVNANDGEGETPLHEAAKNGQAAVAEQLLANKADINATTAKGVTPLTKAVIARHLPMVKLLLERKADPNVSPVFQQRGVPEETYPSDFAQRLAAIQRPVQNWSEGNYPLHLAVKLNEPVILKVLLDAGADPNRRSVESSTAPHSNENGWTPLIMAVVNGKQEMAEMLLKHKADPNLASESGIKPLMYAGLNPEIAELLLSHGADGSGTNADGNTPLHLAVLNGQTKLAQAILAKKIDVNAKNQKGETALHLAVQLPDAAIAEALLAAGADVNPRNNNAETPLHLAVPRLKTKLVELLLTAKADVNARNGYQKTPLGMLSPLPPQAPAALVEMASLLRQHGGLDDLPRYDQIEVRRSSANYSNVVFIKGTNDLNRFTLFEVIAAQYGLIAGDEADSRLNTGMRSIPTRTLRLPSGYSGPLSGLAFPDFERLKILSPTPKGFRVNNEGVRYHPDCSENKALAWGTVIEIPEADHPINANWQGLTPEFREFMANCLKREVTLIIKGQATNLVLRPSTNGTSQAQFYLRPVLMNSGLIRTSSDLSKVKVKRHDKTTGQVYELTFDCSDSQGSPNAPQPSFGQIQLPVTPIQPPPRVPSPQPPPSLGQYPGGPSAGQVDFPTDLWLRDGDIIEVPDKS